MKRLILFVSLASILCSWTAGCGSHDIIKEHDPCGCIATCSCMHCVLASRICDCEPKLGSK